MVNAQTWLDKEYPKDRRNEKTSLNISKGEVKKWLIHDSTLKGDLKLEGFTNLRVLNCSGHELTGLDLSECKNLRELDCSNNELNNLNISGCSRLEKINCSNNNHIRGLDLSTCDELEEVDINGCSKLTADKMESKLFHDDDNGKLLKISPRITQAGDNDIRNILIIGWTGNGKSNLANTLTDTNQFKTEESSTSVTTNFQKSDTFEWKNEGRKAKYRVIDNIGFGDTNNLKKEDLLYRVGQGIYSARSGINQVLFVAKGRFSPEQIEAFKTFKDFIAEIGITKFTTIVRTGFKDFRSQEKCLEDKETLLTQSEEVRKIIKSCNDIVYVDNPLIPEIDEEDDEDERVKKERRTRIDVKKKRIQREGVEPPDFKLLRNLQIKELR